jgi:hypothetical protein
MNDFAAGPVARLTAAPISTPQGDWATASQAASRKAKPPFFIAEPKAGSSR